MEYSFKEELKKYGLNDKEISIYIFLLSSGSKSISKITTGLGIPRTTIVENISRLVEKGLVAESIENSKKHFIAESPLKLKEILSNKRRSVEQELQSLNKMDTVLPSIVNSLMMHQLKESSEDISIRFYKTKRDVWKGYLESLKSSEVYSFCYLDKYYEVFPNTRDLFKNAFSNESNRRVFDILIDTPLARNIAKDGHNQYFTKFLPKNSYLTGFVFGDYMIFDNKVMIVQLSSKHPMAVIIESEEVYLSFKGLHKTMWELL